MQLSVASDPPSRAFFRQDIYGKIGMDMNLIENRQDLVNRYNAAVGTPGPLVRELQHHFLAGGMPSSRISHYVEQCEAMIEARMTMSRPVHA